MILSQEHKKKHYFFLSKRIVVCFLISITLTNAYAQTQRGRKDDAKAEEISFKDRWGIKTNAVDWLLTIPNIGVEFDLGNTIRNKRTISANIKWNWNTSQTYTPSLIFNVFDARVEWRQYFRTRQRGGVTKDAGLYTRLKETVFTTQRKNPRQERAYYWGVYVNASSYNLKIGKEGKQGNAYGAGISVGYTAPLYGYRNNYIDLELGGSAGLLYTSYDVYTTQRKNPRQERAYYWGVYVNASSYNLKIGKEGKQGNAYGAGISVGYTAPLYGYRNNYIDLELGGSAGLLYTSYDVYTHDTESNCYPRIADKCKGGHIVPFPLITDLRVAFVYRFMSVGSKYKASVYRRVQIRSEKRNAINAKINAMRLRIDSIAGAVQKQGFSRPDSLLTKEELKQWRLMQQERKEQALKEAADKLRKHVADSLGIQLSDTLTSEQEKTIDKALKEYEKQLKRKAEAQDSTKLGKRAAKDAKQAAKEKKGKKKKKESGKNKKKDGQQEVKATKEDTEAEQEEAETSNKEKKEGKA